MHTESDNDFNSESECTDELKPKSRRNSTTSYVCRIKDCGESFRRLDHLDRHEFKHTGIKKHICLYEGCTKTYSILTHLRRHVRTTHERVAAAQKNVSCIREGCEKLFSSICNMQRHIREVHENPKVYYCTHCSEEFTQKLKMRRHVISMHTGIYPFNCPKCKKGFYQQWQSEKHLNSCKVYPCPNCSQLFEKWSLYQKHCKETQHGRKYYNCEHCERIYGRPSELQKHIIAKHSVLLNGDNLDDKKMAFKCKHEACNRSYSYERNLKQHILTAHSGRKFDCKEEDCSRIFSSAQNLSKHIERVHRQRVNEELKLIKNANKIKAIRKKRKDAGKSIVSNLIRLSGLAVDKDFDKLLRARDKEALDMASAALIEIATEQLNEDLVNEEEKLGLSSVSACSKVNNAEDELSTLISIALQDQ